MSWHLGIDIGGTFTDAVAYDGSTKTRRTAKVWSVRDDPRATVSSALDALGLEATDPRTMTFGTTIVTNAIVQGKLGRVALLTTAGHGDVLDIARQSRRALYDLAAPPREPAPAPRELRFEIDARMRPDGAAAVPVDPDQVRDVLKRLDGAVDSIAVSLLHAYANGEHERVVGEMCREIFPHVSLSHEVWPQLREYERTLATVLNASVMPMAADYIATLGAFLPAGLRLELFHSGGGMMTPEAAVSLPLSLALSGPAAGVEAARRVARDVEAPLAISIDMGGTTTDVCLIVDGQPEIRDQAQVGPWTVNLQMLAAHSIGAGGGSLVRHGPAGIQVGPESAGADPGPACYGRGGALPTLTDAAVVLGYLRPSAHADGGVRIDANLAERAFDGLARQLDTPAPRVARGVVRVANANMARALRRITVDRGVDARDCALIAFGGAGPMYAAELARDVGIGTVLAPRESSLLSAVGCLTAAPSYTRQRTVRLSGVDWEAGAFERACAAIADEARECLSRGRGGEAAVGVEYAVFMRYLGQSHVIEVPCAPESGADELQAAFRRRHEELYGYCTEEPWEVQSLRVTARIDPEIPEFDRPEASGAAPEPVETAHCRFAEDPVATPVYARGDLGPGRVLEGPLIVVDRTSTTVAPPGCRLDVTPHGHLRIDVNKAP